MTTVDEHGWRQDRLADERFRIYIPILGAILLGLLISAAVLNWGEAITGGIFVGVLVVCATFLKPEWALLVIIYLAPLTTMTIEWGTLLPGTGLTPINALALLLIIGTFLQRFSPNEPAATATPLDRILLLYMGWSLFSVFVGVARWGYDSQAIGEWVAMACGYMLYWVVRRRWRSEKLAVGAVILVLVMVAYEAFKVYRQYSGEGTSAFNWELKEVIVGTFPPGNSNDIATYLSVHCMVALGLFLSLRNVFWRWAAFAVFLVGAATTFETYSRASYYALAAGLVAITVVKHRRWLVPAVLAMIIVPSILPGSIQERLNTHGDASAENRKEFWKHGLLEMMYNPVGLGWRGYSKNEAAIGGFMRDPHSMYVLVGSEQGPVGFVLFIGIFVVAGREILAAVDRARTPFTRGLGVGLFGGVVAYAVNNVFGSRMLFFHSVAHFFLLIGILMVLANPPPGGPVVEVVEEPKEKEPKALSPWRYRGYV
jgi:hypothetical protein